MKQITKSFLVICIALLCLLSVPVAAQAATNTPSQVKNLKATTAESAVTLKWAKVSNATGYIIYRLNTTDNTYTKVGTTKSTSYTIKKLANGTSYTYCVAAYRKVKFQTYEGKKSSTVKATPQVKKVGTVKLSVKSCGNQQISLKWSKISGATGYQVFQYNTSSKKIESIGTVTGTSVTVKQLTNGTSYQFKVRAYRTVGGVTRYADYSSVVTVKPLAVSSEAKSMPTMTYKAKVNKTVNASLTSGSGKVTVSKNTTVTVLTRSKSTPCKVQLGNGKTVYIDFTNLTFTSCIYNNKNNLSQQVVEDFVNHKGYHSNTKYLIWISTYKQRVYIFRGSQCSWKLIKNFQCSTGKASTPTLKGTFRLYKKAYFFPFDEYSYANYASYFWSDNAIHSWVKLYGSGAWYRDGSLGKPASHGCVRLGDNQVQYIYNSIPIGTTIVVY